MTPLGFLSCGLRSCCSLSRLLLWAEKFPEMDHALGVGLARVYAFFFKVRHGLWSSFCLDCFFFGSTGALVLHRNTGRKIRGCASTATVFLYQSVAPDSRFVPYESRMTCALPQKERSFGQSHVKTGCTRPTQSAVQVATPAAGAVIAERCWVALGPPLAAARAESAFISDRLRTKLCQRCALSLLLPASHVRSKSSVLLFSVHAISHSMFYFVRTCCE